MEKIMAIELVVMIAGGVLFLLAVLLALYTARLRESAELMKMRATVTASQLMRRAASAEEIANRLKLHLDQIGSWVQEESLPVAHRAAKLDKQAYLLNAEIGYLLDSLEVSGLLETDTAIKKQSAEALVKAAELAIALGNYADAIRRLKRALSFGEDYLESARISVTDILFALGVAYSQWGHEDESKAFVEEGIRHFERSLDRNPRLDSAKHNVAWSYDEMARLTGQEHWFHKAVSSYRELLATTPDFQRARFNLACALRRTDRLEEAFAELEKIPEGHDLWEYIASDEDFTDLPLGWRKRLDALVERKRKKAAAALST